MHTRKIHAVPWHHGRDSLSYSTDLRLWRGTSGDLQGAYFTTFQPFLFVLTNPLSALWQHQAQRIVP